MISRILRASAILIDEICKHTPISEFFSHSGHRNSHTVLDEFHLPVLCIIIEHICYEASVILLRPSESEFLRTGVLLAAVVYSHLIALVKVNRLIYEIIHTIVLDSKDRVSVRGSVSTCICVPPCTAHRSKNMLIHRMTALCDVVVVHIILRMMSVTDHHVNFLELGEELENVIIVLVIVDISATFLCTSSERYMSIEHKHLVFLVFHKVKISLEPLYLCICKTRVIGIMLLIEDIVHCNEMNVSSVK